LLRWAFQQQAAAGGYALEIATVGRLASPALSWWFRRVRCFEFATPDAVSLVLERTGGIPALVGVVDEVLGRTKEETKSKAELEQALGAVNASLREIASRMLTGPEDDRLDPREVELLLLVASASQSFPGERPRDAFMVCWDEISPSAQCQPPGPGDEVPLRLLERLGWLPVANDVPAELPLDRIAAITPGDPILRLCAQLAQLQSGSKT
jgi:hypothetical protein